MLLAGKLPIERWWQWLWFTQIYTWWVLDSSRPRLRCDGNHTRSVGFKKNLPASGQWRWGQLQSRNA